MIYIDGLNLYYGALKDTQWKWLDLDKYFRLLRPDDDIQSIKYFTALIEGSHKINQEIYLSALSTLPKIQIILGEFKEMQIECRVTNCSYPGDRFFQKLEEKRTDVNIALHMFYDAVFDFCDRFILVSGDSDLVPAIHMVKKVAPKKKITVYVPADNEVRGAAVEIRRAADKHLTMPIPLLSKTQFPQSIPLKGGSLDKPASWP